jgi:hypothetical protein
MIVKLDVVLMIRKLCLRQQRPQLLAAGCGSGKPDKGRGKEKLEVSCGWRRFCYLWNILDFADTCSKRQKLL